MSPAPDARKRESGLDATARTMPWWPCRVATRSSVVAFPEFHVPVVRGGGNPPAIRAHRHTPDRALVLTVLLIRDLVHRGRARDGDGGRFLVYPLGHLIPSLDQVCQDRTIGGSDQEGGTVLEEIRTPHTVIGQLRDLACQRQVPDAGERVRPRASADQIIALRIEGQPIHQRRGLELPHAKRRFG